MLYLLYGTKEYLVQNEIKKITKNFENLNISRYDLNNNLIQNIINDCMTISLFSEKKNRNM